MVEKDDHCEVGKKPEEFIYRLTEAEKDIIELHDKFATTKREIFMEMKQNKEETLKKFDRLNIYVISTLTTALISLLILLFKLR